MLCKLLIDYYSQVFEKAIFWRKKSVTINQTSWNDLQKFRLNRQNKKIKIHHKKKFKWKTICPFKKIKTFSHLNVLLKKKQWANTKRTIYNDFKMKRNHIKHDIFIACKSREVSDMNLYLLSINIVARIVSKAKQPPLTSITC